MEVRWGTKKLASLGPHVLWVHTFNNSRLPTSPCMEILRSRDWQAPKAASFEHDYFDIIGGNKGWGMNGSPIPGQCHACYSSHPYEHYKGTPTLGRDSGWQSPWINSPAIFRSTTSQRGDMALPIVTSSCGKPLAGHRAHARAWVGTQQTR